METPLFSSQPFAIIVLPVIVVILAALVYVFGFQKSVEPSFKQLSSATDDKKLKKKKIKEKKSQSNGHAVVIDVPDAKKTEAKQTKVVKTDTPKQKKLSENKKVETPKSPLKKEKKDEAKNKKKIENEKPADFDEGEWETAPSSRKDKKKKKDDQDILAITVEKPGKKATPEKKEVVKKIDKPMEILRIEDILPSKKEDIAVVLEVVQPKKEVLEEVFTPAPAAAPAPAEEQAAKKKKAKKPKVSVSDDDAAPPQVVPPPKNSVEPVPAESSRVFNELEDAWQEAPQKKSKKKARKD